MKLLARNDELLELLNGDYLILDARLYRIVLDESVSTTISYYLITRFQQSIVVVFKDIVEYLFYNTEHCHFYYITRFKLLKTEEYFYLSLDPYDEHSSEVDDENDGWIIKFRNFEAYEFEQK